MVRLLSSFRSSKFVLIGFFILFSCRRIGALKQSQPSQSFTVSDEPDGPAVSPSGTSQDLIQQQSSSQKIPPRNNNNRARSDVAAAAEPPAGDVDSGAPPPVVIDNSSAAHCEVERRRKHRIATSIQTLAEMLQLKEIDPKKLVN